mmetsp:Transcript_4456/g.13415  ORF Transcript_4456/g.13415 Transcript_4456/m.13415 type:complete len:98 (-) Transcript_4456:36-329(-)
MCAFGYHLKELDHPSFRLHAHDRTFKRISRLIVTGSLDAIVNDQLHICVAQGYVLVLTCTSESQALEFPLPLQGGNALARSATDGGPVMNCDAVPRT